VAAIGVSSNFLTRRAAIGNRIYFLRFSGYPHMGEGVIESIKCAVDVFKDGENDGWSDDGSDDSY
jgi:hypothetical protein